MPRKKDPPPSTLPPRRSARGASKSTSLLDGEDAESFVVPLVGFGDSQVGEDSLQPSLLPSGSNLCNINKEISLVPSVTVSLDESEQGLRSINKEKVLENSASTGTLLAGKTGLAGSVTELSDGLPGVRSLSGSRNDSDGVGFAVASPKPPATPLFSPEFKAMLDREYPRKMVFSPRPMLSGEATEGRGLWDGLPQSRSESVGESISMPVAHGSSPDVGVHVHVPEDGDEHGSAVHSVHAKEGTNLSSGVALYEGVQATNKVWNGMHASAELHGGGDLPMPKPLGVEVVQDVQVHVPGTGLETEFEVKAIEENHSGPIASVEGIHGLHGVYGEVRNEVLHVLNREEGLHAHSNVVHGGLDEVPMQPIEVAKVAPEGRDGINVGLVDDGVGPLGGSEVEQTTESNSVSMDFDQDATVEIPASQPLVCTGGRSSQTQDPKDTDMNLELSAPLQNFVTKQDAKSVWNSPSAGMESFADKIKKANEIEGPHSGTKASAGVGDSDGFTTVTRRKKMGPFNMQRKKQNPVRVKVSSQQYAPVRSNVNQIPVGSSVPHSSNTPVSTRDVNKSGVNKPPTVGLNVPKKVSKGFNFARAVQGDLGSKSQHTSPVNMISKTTAIPKPVDLVTPNRFSVLDFPNSIKYNKLIGVQDDLDPPDQVLEEGMDVDSNKAICSNKFVCQLNREHVEGSRILPESILSPPKQAGESSTGKTYGISDKQKMDIADRLKNAGSIKVDIVDQWCPGQWDFFNDLCTLMGLDPDYCIEDVDSDTENEMYQFMSGLPSSDAPKTSRK
ncbi:hypothetical protein L1987_64518 [Smallanthus sonchifolius]|uniref:Uncharacterized protein n=1 Tax=Smallanthus sonchifolius TaxID=185202 RepID=A0ACB9BRT3_9ASTR|nr:hypothetical protein L1987_64518 [Smallanthus sonchifolius]